MRKISNKKTKESIEMRKRKTMKQNGGNMAEAQRRIDKWVTNGEVNKELILTDSIIKI